MGNAVLNVVDGVGGAVNAVVGGVGGALGGLKNACFPGGGGDGGPGGAASRGSLRASGIDARSPTADPPPYQPPTPASGSAVIGAGSGGQQMLVASSTGMSVPSGVPEEKVSSVVVCSGRLEFRRPPSCLTHRSLTFSIGRFPVPRAAPASWRARSPARWSPSPPPRWPSRLSPR